jgi:hypothetical protein
MPAPAKPPTASKRKLARIFKSVIALQANANIRKVRIAHPIRTMTLFGIPLIPLFRQNFR